MENNKKLLAFQALFLLFFLVIALGSATNNSVVKESSNWQEEEKEVMNSWVGASKAQLIQSWGPPNRTTDDGQGGEILIYDRTVTFPQMPGTVYSQPYGNNLYYTAPQSTTITRSRMFYVDKNGKIYHWMCQGRQGY